MYEALTNATYTKRPHFYPSLNSTILFQLVAKPHQYRQAGKISCLLGEREREREYKKKSKYKSQERNKYCFYSGGGGAQNWTQDLAYAKLRECTITVLHL